MSVRLRISVLRLRQLSIGRFYDCGYLRKKRPEVDLVAPREEGPEAAPRVRELASRARGVAGLGSVTGSRDVMEGVQEPVLVEVEALAERSRGGDKLTPLEL